MATGSPDVVVIGGGVVGCATAYYLTRRGARVTVIERDSLGSHASGFALGMLSGYRGIGDAAQLALSRASMALHAALAKDLLGESGISFDYEPLPTLWAAMDEADQHEYLQQLRLLQAEGFPARWLSLKDARLVEPRLSDEVIGALHIEASAHLEPYKLVLALAQAAERRGATIRHGEVTRVVWDGDRVQGVGLASGPVVQCDRLVIAMGPWSSAASAWLGVPISVTPLRGQLVRLRLDGPPVSCYLRWKDGAAVTKSDGLVYVGTTLEDAGFDEVPTTAARDQMLRSCMAVLPAIQEGEIVRQTACLRPLSADGLPVLGPVPDKEGVWVATGGAAIGILLAPIMGRVVADLVFDGNTDLDIGPFLPGRFSTMESGSPRTLRR